MPVCTPRSICGNCDTCYKISFASHPKAVFWSDQNDLKPRLVFRRSTIKFWFDCSCSHSFMKDPKAVCSGHWCPYCCLSPKLLCGSKDCSTCWEKSLASHPLAAMYSSRNELESHQVFLKTNKSFQFDCPTCEHSFEAMAYNIAAGKGCPFCSLPCKKLCTDQQCQFCFAKSFAAHSRAADWSEENSREPRDVMRCCNDAFKFDCKACQHTFLGRPNDMSRGVDCPFCSCPKADVFGRGLPTLFQAFLCQPPDVRALVPNKCHAASGTVPGFQHQLPLCLSGLLKSVLRSNMPCGRWPILWSVQKEN